MIDKKFLREKYCHIDDMLTEIQTTCLSTNTDIRNFDDVRYFLRGMRVLLAWICGISRLNPMDVIKDKFANNFKWEDKWDFS